MRRNMMYLFLLMLTFVNYGFLGMGPEIDSPKKISSKTIDKLQQLSKAAFITEVNRMSKKTFDVDATAFDRKFKSFKISKITFKNDSYFIQGEAKVFTLVKQDIYLKSLNKLAYRKGATENTHAWYRCVIHENNFGDLETAGIEIYFENPNK